MHSKDREHSKRRGRPRGHVTQYSEGGTGPGVIEEVRDPSTAWDRSRALTQNSAVDLFMKTAGYDIVCPVVWGDGARTNLVPPTRFFKRARLWEHQRDGLQLDWR